MILGAKAFEEQMRYLKTQGYRVVNVREFVDFVSQKRQLPRKSVLLTFDDGYRSFLTIRLSASQRTEFHGNSVCVYRLLERGLQRV